MYWVYTLLIITVIDLGSYFVVIIYLAQLQVYCNFIRYHEVRYLSTLTLNNWARCIDRINRQDLTRLITIITNKVYA